MSNLSRKNYHSEDKKFPDEKRRGILLKLYINFLKRKEAKKFEYLIKNNTIKQILNISYILINSEHMLVLHRHNQYHGRILSHLPAY